MAQQFWLESRWCWRVLSNLQEARSWKQWVAVLHCYLDLELDVKRCLFEREQKQRKRSKTAHRDSENLALLAQRTSEDAFHQ
jgi:hypothetical protein